MKNRSSTFSAKKKSITADTHLSHSNIFNNSSLLQTKLADYPRKSHQNCHRSN